MKYGNSSTNQNVKERKNKYIILTGDEELDTEGLILGAVFNSWITDNYSTLKTKMKTDKWDEDVYHETYLKMYEIIAFKKYEVKDFLSYFCRAYYTNLFLRDVKTWRLFYAEGLNPERMEIEDVPYKGASKLEKLWNNEVSLDIEQRFDKTTVALFKLNMGVVYENSTDIPRIYNMDELSFMYGIPKHAIQRRLSEVKKFIKGVYYKQK